VGNLMDSRYINPFIMSTKRVFSTMLDADVTVGRPLSAADEQHRADVSAIIGLSGDATGCVALCFPMTSAICAASAFAKTHIGLDHEDFADALGELASMVAGRAKADLNGLSCSISLPNVIIGAEHVIARLHDTPRLTLPCRSHLGHFCLGVGLAPNRQPRPEPVAASAHDGGS
jgi:chemotaxis protein CheX